MVEQHQELEAERPVARCAPTKDFAAASAMHPSPSETKEVKSQQETAVTEPSGPNPRVIEPDWTCLQSSVFGREEEIEELRKIFRRSLNVDLSGDGTIQREAPVSSDLILISGKSGSGKSALARAALQSLAVDDHHGYYLVGKFDQLQVQTPEPYAPFVAALTDLVSCWENSRSSEWCQEKGQQLLQELGNDNAAVLQALVPALSRMFPALTRSSSCSSSSLSTLPASTTAMGREAQQDRLKSALCKFLRAICSKHQPLVLVLDDCQWSDSGSLVILDHLLQARLSGLLIVAICRSDEVSVHDEFAEVLRMLEDERGTQITHLQVQNLSLAATNQLISIVLQQAPQMCLPLSDIIHEKTQGNVFCLFQLLRALFKNGVLLPDTSATKAELQQWLWDDQKWDEIFKHQRQLDVVDLVSSHIASLPSESQRLLQTAAFLGADFELDLLQVFPWHSNQDTLLAAITETNSQGLIKERPNRHNKYVFCHDQIQLGAYALVPLDQRADFHLTLGRTLYEKLSPQELRSNIFLVVNQMIHGSSLLESQEDKYGLANLCLRAGKQSTRSSDFKSSVFYFERGIELLNTRSCWRDEYLLCLDLYSSLAEVACSTAKFVRMDEAINQVLANARSISDTARAYTTRIYALSARLRPKEALGLGKEVVASLGVALPPNPGILYFIVNVLKVKGKLAKLSDDDVLSLPDIDPNSRNEIAAMTTLSMMATCTYTADESELYPAICFAMVKISLKHGLSAMSSHAFCLLAVVLCAMNDYEGSRRHSLLALKIMDRFTGARAEWLPRVSATVHGLVLPWTKPVEHCFAPLLEAHAIGQDSGDIEFCVLAGHFHSLCSYVSGRPLHAIEKSHAAFYEQMAGCRHETWLAMAALMLEFLRTMLGLTKNPRMIQFYTADETKKASYQAQSLFATICQMVLSFHFGDLYLALDCSKRSRMAERTMKPSPVLWVYYLYDGLTALKAARTVEGGKRRKYLARGKAMAKKFEALARVCPENFGHCMYLLQAELATLQGKERLAMDFYSRAIDDARTEGFLHVLALSCEHYGLACAKWGKSSEAKDLLKQSLCVYQEWGAKAIVSYKEVEYVV